MRTSALNPERARESRAVTLLVLALLVPFPSAADGGSSTIVEPPLIEATITEDAGSTAPPDASTTPLEVRSTDAGIANAVASTTQDVDAIARFLAGLPGPAGGPFAALEATPEWKAHAAAFNASWHRLEQQRLIPMREFQAQELTPKINGARPLVYLFGGPDALTANLLYPRAPVMVLGGLENPGYLIPDFANAPRKVISQALASLRVTLRGALLQSFFVTSQMGGHMRASPFRGVLPVILAEMARMGEHIRALDAVTIAPDGTAQVISRPEGNGPIGWRVTLEREGHIRHLYYIRLNLINASVSRYPEFFKFLETQGLPNVFLKAASFILHDNAFSIIRSYLLARSASVLQDDSGLPFRYFNNDRWNIVLYGTYSRPRLSFRNYRQADLDKAYADAPKRPLKFRTGYRHADPASHLILAIESARAGLPIGSP